MINIATGERMLGIDWIMLAVFLAGIALMIGDLMAIAIGYFIVDFMLARVRAKEGRSFK